MSETLRRLRAVPLSQRAFAPFGTVIAWPEGASASSINAGTSLRLDLLPDLAMNAASGAPCLALFRAQSRAFPLPIVELERHPLGAQLFVPLGRLRFAIVVAPAGPDPSAADLCAFVSDGSQGVLLAPGTWHHALIAIDAGDFVVIERRAAQADCDIVPLATHVQDAPTLELG